MSITQVKKLSAKIEREMEKMQNWGSRLEESVMKFNEAVAVLEEGNEVTPPAKRGPGRPKKNTTTATTTKRGPGRPKKNTTTPTATTTKKRGPGRPKKETVTATTPKRGPGRPKKNTTTTPTATRKPGRPKKTATASHSSDLMAEIKRIENDIDTYNQWVDVSDSEKDMAIIENGTYRAEIVGKFSKGTSGRYGVTTRVYLNPESTLLPEELKHHISTAAINRINYKDTREEGLEYIERMKEKTFEQCFTEILPKVLKNHGKKDSDYAFHLKPSIRRDFNKLKELYDKEYKAKIEKDLVLS